MVAEMRLAGTVFEFDRKPRSAAAEVIGDARPLNAGVEAMDRQLDAVDWVGVSEALDGQGWAVLPGLFTPAQADSIAALYDREDGFRSQVVMARHGFGRGAYKYFSYPLPERVQALRTSAYPHLAPIANRWQARLGKDVRFPHDHVQFLARCHDAGQVRPTPLLLQYGPGDYNCLHRDLYGDHVFPLQIAVLLDQPGEDFTGGEFVMTEQRPRMQTRAMVLPLRKGDAAVFAVAGRPMQGVRGDYQVKLNHGVSKLNSGKRHTLGVIFHDAL
jgi:hypothetical protein